MTFRSRRALAALFVGALALGACERDPEKGPLRPKSHGYRAHATVKDHGKIVSEFEIAVRGDRFRKEPVKGQKGPVLIQELSSRKAVELDPAAKTFREVPFVPLDTILPSHPLSPGFSYFEEARRRGVTEYARESDTIYAGHVCWLSRYEDRPGEEQSPTTTYWAAPDLDLLVIRVDREQRKDGVLVLDASTQLTNVRIQALPSLFQVPKGYKKL